MSEFERYATVTSRGGWSRMWRGVRFTLALVVVGAAGYVVALCSIEARPDEIANWVSTFVTSPGAAGLAAVCAALIGATAIRHQLAHNKHVERSASWWKSFEWITERALPTDGRPGLPFPMSLDMLFPLTQTATTPVQARACGSFVDHLTNLTSAAEAPTPAPAPIAPETTTVTWPPGAVPADANPAPVNTALEPTEVTVDVPAYPALRNWVQHTKHSPARSVQAEAHLYALQVHDAVLRATARAGLDRWVKTKASSTDRTVFEVAGGGRFTVIATMPASSMALQRLAIALEDTSDPTMLVTPRKDTGIASDPTAGVWGVRWEDEGDDAALQRTLENMWQSDAPGPASAAAQ